MTMSPATCARLAAMPIRRLGVRGVPTAARRSKSVAATTAAPLFSLPSLRKPNFAMGLGGGLLLAGLHSATGSANDFYDYRFETKKDPDDLASFYGGEELMELFCVFPIMGRIMMRNGRFDDEGSFTTTGFPGRLKVNMVFSDEQDEASGRTDWFNKRERFRDTLFGYTCWDMVLNFGFRTLEDGTRECYHFGEYFHGNVPVVSQIGLLVFKIHARWVAWSTEHHINRYAFAPDDERLEEMEERSRANMPLFLLKNYAWSDLKAMAFGRGGGDGEDGDEEDRESSEKKRTSFLVTADAAAAPGDEGELDDDDDDEGRKLPFQRRDARMRIDEDIDVDRRAMKDLLSRENARGAADVEAVLVRRHTLLGRRRTGARDDDDDDEGGPVVAPPPPKDAYALAKDLAVDRARARRATRRRTLRGAKRVDADA